MVNYFGGFPNEREQVSFVKRIKISGRVFTFYFFPLCTVSADKTASFHTTRLGTLGMSLIPPTPVSV